MAAARSVANAAAQEESSEPADIASRERKNSVIWPAVSSASSRMSSAAVSACSTSIALVAAYWSSCVARFCVVTRHGHKQHVAEGQDNGEGYREREREREKERKREREREKERERE